MYVSPEADNFAALKRLEALIPWDKLSEMVKAKFKDMVDEFQSDLHHYVQEDMRNNAAWNVVAEAQRMAERLLDDVLKGNVNEFENLVSYRNKYGSMVGSSEPVRLWDHEFKLDDTIALRRALLMTHADLFERIVLDDHERLERAYKQEIGRLKAEIARLRDER